MPTALVAAVLSGCSGGNGLIAVKGTVSVDGTAVDEGLVTFLPLDGDGPTAQAVIASGAFRVDVAPGEKIVRIQGFKIVGHEHAVRGNPDSPLLPVRENFVPEKFNARSELRCTVDRDSTQHDFDLPSA